MSADMTNGCDTLRILRLPPQLADERRNELFQKYGAVKTRTLRPSGKCTITYAKFLSCDAAREALLRLHQLRVRGQYLCVEFAEKSLQTELSEIGIHREEDKSDDGKKDSISKSHFQAFLQRLNSWSMNQMFMQPPPPNIRYKYNAPTRGTLLRIAIQMVREPNFYTQVLHLMNRMSLPPPFEELESEFPMLKEIYDVEKYQDIFGRVVPVDEENNEEDEEESEIESDEEGSNKPKEIIPMKRKRPQGTKRLKIPKFVNPAKHNVLPTSGQKTMRPEDMFESMKREDSKARKIEFKTLDKSLETARVPDVAAENPVIPDGGFGLMFPTKTDEEEQSKEQEDEEEKQQEFITSEELASNRISTNDQRLLPVFKSYHPGKPSNRLYIKNLAKQVEMKDLQFIYKRYLVPNMENPEHEYDVRLMQEGRMKGQAFVTLQNVTQAQLALDETNGYILKDKPIVVQFAKSTKS